MPNFKNYVGSVKNDHKKKYIKQSEKLKALGLAQTPSITKPITLPPIDKL